MKIISNYKFLTLILLLVFASCNPSNRANSMNGKWNNVNSSRHFADYVEFKNNNEFSTKHQSYRYTGAEYTSFDDKNSAYTKTIIDLDYNIDSTDVNNGYYYTISNDSFSERRYALVDYPYFINCGIKPKPEDQSYLYWPKLFISDEIDSSEIHSNYYNFDLLLSDTLGFGEIILNFNDQNEMSSIKKTNKNVAIKSLGVTDVGECFDIRYYVFEKYRAYVKSKNTFEQIPFIHKDIFFGYRSISEEELNTKKEFISKVLPSDSSRCVIFANLNMARWYYEKYHNRNLEGNDVVIFKYTNRKLLFTEYDQKYMSK